MAVSATGLLFAFGSNSQGQCGLGNPAETDIRIQTIPMVVERFRALDAKVELVSCGSAHTLVLCSLPALAKLVVFAMGLNSSGQLGLGKTGTVYRPTQLVFPEGVHPIGVATGPLSFHSFVFTEGVPLAHPSLPSIDLKSLRQGVERITLATQRYGPSSNDVAVELLNLRQMIADAFSSLSVLNASFRIDPSSHSAPSESFALTVSHPKSNLCIDLQAVRRSYDLIFSIDNEQVIATLGRATLQLAEHLRECPFDDQENLSVFLIVLENPLMLRASTFHIAIERFLSGMLALPSTYQVVLFGWYRSYASEYFSRALLVLQEYISFALTSKVTGINPVHAVLVMQNLHVANKTERIVPDKNFYNRVLSRSIDMLAEWERYKASGKDSQVFNYFAYPFLVDLNTKSVLLHRDFQEKKKLQSYKHLNSYLGKLRAPPSSPTVLQALFPAGVKVCLIVK